MRARGVGGSILWGMSETEGTLLSPNRMSSVEKDCHWDQASEGEWKRDTSDLIQIKKNSYCHRPEMLRVFVGLGRNIFVSEMELTVE